MKTGAHGVEGSLHLLPIPAGQEGQVGGCDGLDIGIVRLLRDTEGRSQMRSRIRDCAQLGQEPPERQMTMRNPAPVTTG